MPENPVILFDGICNLCNRSVLFIIKRDRKKKFLFASIQGEKGKDLFSKLNLPLNDINSFVLIDKGKAYTRSSGALRVLKELGGKWRLWYACIIVPKFIRDGVYKWIAKNRYKWFGKKETCMTPAADLKERFLD
ncbi:MAG: thiol-disulfide oxidoreductase DCC family protein [Chitinophagaceae bacterium]|nr:thiol-disulfide oxidoreductase DCC family protein [Chitinophagaceae bacterium]